MESKYKVIEKTMQELVVRFTYHKPKKGQNLRYEQVRDDAGTFAANLCRLCPESRELSLALTKLEEVVFWANSAIARRE